jgi:ATP-binding cassette subfamily G (WHITE) protein 2 (SNQ2)
MMENGPGINGRPIDASELFGSPNSLRRPSHSRSTSSSANTPNEDLEDDPGEYYVDEEAHAEDSEDSEDSEGRHFAPLKATPSASTARPGPSRLASGSMSHDDISRVLSRRWTSQTQKSEAHSEEQRAEVERLISRMFGQGRQDNSEEEHTRHVGVVFKHLTVKGVGLGAALQPTIGDIFLNIPRKILALLQRNTKIRDGAPIRTIINDFNGLIRPGEMLLVLGRPGSGCSTFLKVLGNQRAGFKSVEGDVLYGGESAEKMARDFRGEILYNPEDDLHYATITVKRTLEFALRTRTPGKESRLEGESRKQYVQDFLQTVTKLCKPIPAFFIHGQTENI